MPKAARLGHPDNIHDVRALRRRYPNVALVIAHLGRFYTGAHALEALRRLADDPGIYFDSSAVLNPASHRITFRHFGPQRVLYGSDNPILYNRLPSVDVPQTRVKLSEGLIRMKISAPEESEKGDRHFTESP